MALVSRSEQFLLYRSIVAEIRLAYSSRGVRHSPVMYAELGAAWVVNQWFLMRRKLQGD